MLKHYFLALCLWFTITLASAEVAIPELSKRVTDLTATLTTEQTQNLEDKLAAFEARKGSQIAVLILPSTQPEAIEAYSIRVAEAWKIGRKNIDDGVILLIAKDDRQLRLEVGRGLEGVIPDAIAKRVLAETIKPHFKSGDFYAGIDAGITQVIGLIDGEKLPEPSATTNEYYDFDGFMIAIFFISVFIDLVLSALMGRGIGTLVGLPSIGFISALLAPFFALKVIPCIVAGVSMFLVLKIFTGFTNNSGGSSGWTDGSGSSSSWSSSDSSWSGGGGDFGGGGASDSWEQ